MLHAAASQVYKDHPGADVSETGLSGAIVRVMSISQKCLANLISYFATLLMIDVMKIY